VNLRFVYKIHSGYDGFRPGRIPERLQPGNLLQLGWTKYLDVVERGAEVWVYFHGPERFDNGVYIKGIVRSVNRDDQFVMLRVREHSTTTPLTDADMSARVAAVVAQRYRQVFLLPTELVPIPVCEIAGSATTCKVRLCDECPIWKAFPLIDPRDLQWPLRVRSEVSNVVAAYWVIPSRCYLHSEHKIPSQGVRQISEQFYRFKVGAASLAYPLALGMFTALRGQGLVEFDAVVPIPLSPEKEARKEIHRTRLLARELARLLGLRVVEPLSLNQPISKRALGLSPGQFEIRYSQALVVSPDVSRYGRILLVDDVATRGSTLGVAAESLHGVNPTMEIVAVTAGQMILKDSVAIEERIVA
jgi:predicted amidophosphoribosyltransferase